MRVFGDSISGNCLKVKWTSDLLGIAYEWVEVDILKNGSRTPEFLTMNPAGQVPVILLDDGRSIAQSNAIILYLAEGSGLVPADPFIRAKMMEWLFWEQYSHEPYIAVARFQLLYLRKTVAELEGRLVERGNAALARLETALRDCRFLLGDDLSLADISLVAYTRMAHHGGFVAQSVSERAGLDWTGGRSLGPRSGRVDTRSRSIRVSITASRIRSIASGIRTVLRAWAAQPIGPRRAGQPPTINGENVMTPSNEPVTLELMQTEWALLRLSNLYARAMDRNEPELLDTIFTDDAVLEGAWFKVEGLEKIRAMPAALHARYAAMMHVVHNQTTVVRGDIAEGETYCIAHHVSTGAERGGPTVFDMGIRYHSQWQLRDGLWRFTSRRITLDWTEIRPARLTVN